MILPTFQANSLSSCDTWLPSLVPCQPPTSRCSASGPQTADRRLSNEVPGAQEMFSEWQQTSEHVFVFRKYNWGHACVYTHWMTSGCVCELLMDEVTYVGGGCAVNCILWIAMMSSARAGLEHLSKRFGGTSVGICV